MFTGTGKEEYSPSVSKRDEIVIRRTTTVAVKVPLEINKCRVKAVVDTGASVKVLSDRVYSSIPAANRPQLRKDELYLRVAEENTNMMTMEITDVEITISDKCFTWPVYIAPIDDEMMLGCDLIDEWDITVNTRSKGAILMDGKWIQCEIARSKINTCRVTVLNNVTIPPLSEMLIEGVPENQQCLDSEYSMLEPVFKDRRDILPARALVDSFRETIPVRYMNLSSNPVKLK